MERWNDGGKDGPPRSRVLRDKISPRGDWVAIQQLRLVDNTNPGALLEVARRRRDDESVRKPGNDDDVLRKADAVEITPIRRPVGTF